VSWFERLVVNVREGFWWTGRWGFMGMVCVDLGIRQAAGT
jgi:hypothetical protein